MVQDVTVKNKGLYDYSNDVDPDSLPKGAWTGCSNVVIDAENLAQPRRGYEPWGDVIPVPSDNSGIKAFIPYEEHLEVNYDDKLGWMDPVTEMITLYSGTYEAPTAGHKIRGVEANQNLYITTDRGILKQDAYTATPIEAGVAAALNGVASLVDMSGFLADGFTVAYRMIWQYTDGNNNVLPGPPSSRVVIGNDAGGARNVELTFYIPDSITSNYTFRIFRTKQSTVEPDDDMSLCIEGPITTTNITNGYFTVTDTIPDSLLGEALYTSPSREGIANANFSPPFATEVVYFKNSVLYANTRSKQRFNCALISTGGSLGLQLDDTITIGGQVYTAKASEDASNGYFELFTSGTPSTDVANTVESLVRVINLRASNTAFYAFYTSNFNDVPGKFTLEERGINGSEFIINSSAPDVWNPTLPSSGGTVHSINDLKPNGIYVSKDLQPEAVPLYRFQAAGNANKEIARLCALKSAVVIFKDDGLFRLTGESYPFTIDIFEPSTKLLVPNSAVVLNNRVYGYTSQGMVAVSDSGAEIIDRPIKGTLAKLATYPNFVSASFGVAYESDNQYWFYTVSDPDDVGATQVFVYNYVTETWTRQDGFEIEQLTSAIVNPADNKQYLGGVGGVD